ncbi:cohesin domain-containing protein [Patescibacteria group bacterium]|nr:cohesin domain-containing protein [Patescibacteria group bacterium]MBU1448984.1 cohesin domain-containing protein [Patescibacteria group bacterium]MBU2613457.1 cohesin domain-containing protein [Patescibacteria group bacterium]
MNRLRHHRFSALVLACLFVCIAAPVSAAEFYFDAPSQLGIGDVFEAAIFLNTEDINAVGGTVVFPSDVLQLTDIREANSIINLWVEKPTLVSDGQIAFSGITPGGYHGSRGLLLTFVFTAKQEGEGAIEVKDAQVLLNDGKGTETALSIFPHRFTVSGTPGVLTVPPVIDGDRPESFAPDISHDPNLFGNQWFVVFATQDKGSGIDYYEVKEARQKISGMFTKWTTAESPYVLRDRALRSTVYVKAVDKAGNVRIERIAPRNPLHWYENYEIWILIVMILSLIVASSTFVWRKRNTT